MAFDRCIFDIETDGLLDTITRVHHIAIMDADTEELASYHTEEELDKALKTLRTAKELIGHNIICFDLPALHQVYGFEPHPSSRIIDTLVCTRLIWSDLKNDDFKYRPPRLPLTLYGRHSLEAWGLRIGEYKDDFGKTTDWQSWSPEMAEYCEQDVRVTHKLLQRIEAKRYSQDALRLEHDFQRIILKQEQFGFCFDQKAAVELYATLAAEREALSGQLQKAFPPVTVEEEFIPARDNKTRGYVKGVPFIKRKEVAFNPSSRTHIANRLKERYGWEPVELTDKGAPKIDDEVLSALPYPEAPLISRYLMLEKRLGQLSEGSQAWLKNIGKDGRIHGHVNTNGAVTGRCTHSYPNIAQVPSVGSEYGADCRALFGPPPGYYQLGCDASGLELRCLAHYMARYDGGAYRDEVLHGDIHTANQKAAGLETRNEAKRFIYAFLYGAGDALIGSLIDPSLTDPAARSALGKRIKTKFLKGMPALAQLINDVQVKVKARGHLIGIDGRVLPARSPHSALNLLLQSAGAVAMKKATVILWERLAQEGFTFGKDIAQMAHIHDEFQLAVRDDIHPDTIGQMSVDAIRDAGESFHFRCPLDGEYKVGHNWAECH